MDSTHANVLVNNLIIALLTSLTEGFAPFYHHQESQSTRKADESCCDEGILKSHALDPWSDACRQNCE